MTYDFKIVVPPVMHSFCPMYDQAKMIEDIRQTKSVTLEVNTQTKTSLIVMVSKGQASFACSYIPDGCENIKFHSQDRRNMWSGGAYTGNYFKMLKSQKWPEFRFYLEKLLDSLNLNIEGTLTVNVELPVDIQAKLEAPAYI